MAAVETLQAVWRICSATTVANAHLIPVIGDVFSLKFRVEHKLFLDQENTILSLPAVKCLTELRPAGKLKGGYEIVHRGRSKCHTAYDHSKTRVDPQFVYQGRFFARRVRAAAGASNFGGGMRGGTAYINTLYKIGKLTTEILELRYHEIKDHTRGLIDFPSMRGDRVVLLCWQLGEPEEIEWWHETDAGFAGRQPL